MGTPDVGQRGFALMIVLILLAALYVGATGIFLAARAELQASANHAAAERAFHAVQGGLATWFAAPVQMASVVYDIGNFRVQVRATQLLRVDSATVLYRVEAGVEPVDSTGVARTDASGRSVVQLASGSDGGRIVPLRRTWNERF